MIWKLILGFATLSTICMISWTGWYGRDESDDRSGSEEDIKANYFKKFKDKLGRPAGKLTAPTGGER